MHFAAFAYVGESVTDPAKYYHNNVVGLAALLDAMVRNGVDKIIFSSTLCDLWRARRDCRSPKTRRTAPINPYGFTKLAVERALADYERAYGLRCGGMRYFNAAGGDPTARLGEDHDPETHAIPLAHPWRRSAPARVARCSAPTTTAGRHAVRDYIHVSDLADAHALGAEYLAKAARARLSTCRPGAA